MQANQAIQTAAIEAYNPRTRDTLLKLLNEDGVTEIHEMRKTPLGKFISKLLREKAEGKSSADREAQLLVAGAGRLSKPEPDAEVEPPNSDDSESKPAT